ncbi:MULTISPECIES: 2-hydroxychromene-2-carboxylate isomerase [unclassified Sphingopyxis]|uniref:2-hydroxychromene-2-carboxylate isomerase n=1 Tax=unclassified Sphingopyxis TaxID=2614943 RepID=UPI0028605949|nr:MULTISPECIES: 2-hydroxychromene-2-carboxylate isomerase [unclassified Sphingopyxis]MDR6834064.1 2-hydroxychromene-2-carboxylate isomerase [Sphingopyxis sp. BE122]MDR7226332.1 2-hydroxychromene-2-carboxylate isomerase [Sphingopyxis sp. BE259]
MTQDIELFYDFRSPYGYLAFTQLREMDVAVGLRPMKILTVMEKVGNVPTTITCAAKGRYARADLGRWAGRYGITLNPSNMRDNDGDACSRAVLAAASPTEADAITLALYRACWSEGKTLATSGDILAAIAAAGLDAASIAARLDAADVVAQLDANTDEAVERGVFGSPSIFVGDTMFFGNDRLEFVREELARLEKAA